MKNYAFLFWAYTVVWFGIAGYIVFLMLRLRDVGARVARLERSGHSPSTESRKA